MLTDVWNGGNATGIVTIVVTGPRPLEQAADPLFDVTKIVQAS
jgi:hypothetical protein